MPKIKPKSLSPSKDASANKNSDATTARTSRKDKDSEAIKQFLVSCSPFEAETIRTLITLADGETTPQEISETDEFIINGYLNIDFKKNVDMCSDALIAYRQSRVIPVVKLASPFMDKGQVLFTVDLLLQIASSDKSATAFLKQTKGTPLSALSDTSSAKTKTRKTEKSNDDDVADETPRQPIQRVRHYSAKKIPPAIKDRYNQNHYQGIALWLDVLFSNQPYDEGKPKEQRNIHFTEPIWFYKHCHQLYSRGYCMAFRYN